MRPRVARRYTRSPKLDSPNSDNNVQYAVVTKTPARTRLPMVTDQRGSSRAMARKTKENKSRPAITTSESTRNATVRPESGCENQPCDSSDAIRLLSGLKITGRSAVGVRTCSNFRSNVASAADPGWLKGRGTAETINPL